MENTKKLQLSVSVPFSFRQKVDALSGIHLVNYPEREAVYKYFVALQGEMENCAADLDDVQIDAIRFIGGGIHFFWQNDLRSTMKKLTECFACTPDVELISYGEPGQITSGPCAVLKEYGFRQIIDLFSYSLTECQRARTAYKAGQALTKYHEMEIPILGLRTSMGLVRRSSSEWAQQTEGILRAEPEIVELMDARCEQDEDEVARFFERMKQEGYERVRPYLLSRGYVPRFDYRPQGEYLGVGLDATCRLDGYLTQNASDLAYYTQYADDYSKLYQKIEQYEA